MNDRKIVLFPAFRYLVPARFEDWLELMAAQGWQTGRFRQWSSLVMTFWQSKPKKYRFVYDPQVSPRKEYIQTYQQFGWEYLGRMASAHIWRMEYDIERPEAFSDRESLVKRNRRNIAAVSVSFSLFLTAVLAIGLYLLFSGGSLSRGDRTQLIAAEVFFGIIMFALGAVMLVLRKNQSR